MRLWISEIRETKRGAPLITDHPPTDQILNLSVCVDSSSNTIKSPQPKNLFHVSGVMCQVSGVPCYVSHVMSCVSRVAYHISLMPTTTTMDPPPAYSPTMHSRMVFKDQKIYFCPLQILIPLSFPNFSLRNNFVIDRFDLDLCKWE